MFVVRFIRADGQPNEEYFYQKIEDAIYHFSLFEGDDSGLYKSITVQELCFSPTHSPEGMDS